MGREGEHRGGGDESSGVRADGYEAGGYGRDEGKQAMSTSPIRARGVNSDGVTQGLMELGTECYRLGICSPANDTDALTQAVF